MSKRCESCNAPLISTESTCPYCGTENPNYVKPSLVSDVIDSISQKTSEVIRETVTRNKGVGKNKPKFNVLVFIILLIVFWPFAILYLILSSIK